MIKILYSGYKVTQAPNLFSNRVESEILQTGKNSHRFIVAKGELGRVKNFSRVAYFTFFLCLAYNVGKGAGELVNDSTNGELTVGEMGSTAGPQADAVHNAFTGPGVLANDNVPLTYDVVQLGYTGGTDDWSTSPELHELLRTLPNGANVVMPDGVVRKVLHATGVQVKDVGDQRRLGASAVLTVRHEDVESGNTASEAIASLGLDGSVGNWSESYELHNILAAVPDGTAVLMPDGVTRVVIHAVKEEVEEQGGGRCLAGERCFLAGKGGCHGNGQYTGFKWDTFLKLARPSLSSDDGWSKTPTINNFALFVGQTLDITVQCQGTLFRRTKCPKFRDSNSGLEERWVCDQTANRYTGTAEWFCTIEAT